MTANKTAFCLDRWTPQFLAVALLCFPLHNVSGADRSSPAKNLKAKPEPAPRISSDQSIEAIAESARQSVVVISHFGRDGKEDGVGTGFGISSNGLIATSLHVIGEARPITVQLANGKRYDVTEVHAWDRKLDLALIRIDANNLPALPLGDSDSLKQGKRVVAMGNPLGLQHSIVQGVVSARRDFDGLEMIQLAIPVEPGNSGGPLLDMQGRVQGILTMKSALTPNLGFATPINALQALVARPNPVPMDRWLTIGALNPREWTPLFGARWSQKTGRIQVDGLGKGFGGRSLCLSQKPVPEQPYELAVAVRLDDEAGAAGLVFESDGDQNHYGFYPSAGQLRLTRFDGPSVFSWTILQQVHSSHYRPGDWNTLKVRVENEKILCYVNDQLVIESMDRKRSGHKAGLVQFRETPAMFKNFQLGGAVISSEPAPPAELVAAITNAIQDFSGEPDSSLIAKLRSNASLSRSVLSLRASQLEHQAARLRQLAASVHREAAQAELVKALEGPEEKIDLFYAALLVSKVDNPEFDLESYRRQLDLMALEIAGPLPAKATDAVKLARLKNYLFAENGFHGSRTDYYNRANSYLNEVLDDREGLPITLSVLFLELARRIGLENVAGVPLPGHFVVKHAPRNGEEQLIDVFNGGKTLTRAEANTLVVGYTGGPLDDEQLKPATKREIIIRMLDNLEGISQSNGSAADSLRYLDLIVALAPDAAKERWNRALMRLQIGDQAGAKQDVKWILDNQPPGIDLERVAELYHSL